MTLLVYLFAVIGALCTGGLFWGLGLAAARHLFSRQEVEFTDAIGFQIEQDEDDDEFQEE